LLFLYFYDIIYANWGVIMQIKGMFDYLYFKFIEPDIEKELSKSTGFKLNKDFAPSSFQITSFGDYNEYVEVFKELFRNSFPKEYYNKMLDRIRTLRIIREKDKVNFKHYISVGRYDSYNNTITITDYDNIDIDIDKEEVLMHELMHMASTNTTSHGIKTGLELDGLIGMQLNEGYTEYLTRKYLTRGYRYTKHPEKTIILVKGIENIVGEEKMQQCYFESDLNSLIDELSKYMTRKEAITLIYLIDKVSDISYNTKYFDYLVREISKINKSKLDKELEQGQITPQEYEKEVAIKVREYRMYQLWSEDTKVIDDGSSFILEDHGRTSRPYPKQQAEISQEIRKKYM